MKKIFIFLSLLGVCTLGFTQKKSPYITKVFEYRPAPGQFINEMPLYEKGDTKERMVQKVQNCIQGDTKILISLGGYGGYLIFGFDHLVQNVEGKNDFKIWGNAFYAGTNPNSGASKEGGSCEPGIVWVAYDANGDGLPNDTWYELAGSEYYKSETLKAYQITYYKPDENKIRIPDPLYPFLNDTTYIRWTSNQATQGYIYRNTFHDQSYYPNWIEEDSLSFCGTKLADNQIDESGNGSYFVQYAYPWGYADNH
ncbi:MAG: cell surface protein, partial [Bacteroidales bacterium]